MHIIMNDVYKLYPVILRVKIIIQNITLFLVKSPDSQKKKKKIVTG